MENASLISIVCPVFNEEESIPLFYKRLKAVLDHLHPRYEFEIIFINNRSTDRSLEVIRGLRETDPSVQVLTLSRNFGYQASVLAGLRHACGSVDNRSTFPFLRTEVAYAGFERKGLLYEREPPTSPGFAGADGSVYTHGFHVRSEHHPGLAPRPRAPPPDGRFRARPAGRPAGLRPGRPPHRLPLSVAAGRPGQGGRRFGPADAAAGGGQAVSTHAR